MISRQTGTNVPRVESSTNFSKDVCHPSLGSGPGYYAELARRLSSRHAGGLPVRLNCGHAWLTHSGRRSPSRPPPADTQPRVDRVVDRSPTFPAPRPIVSHQRRVDVWPHPRMCSQARPIQEPPGRRHARTFLPPDRAASGRRAACDMRAARVQPAHRGSRRAAGAKDQRPASVETQIPAFERREKAGHVVVAALPPPGAATQGVQGANLRRKLVDGNVRRQQRLLQRDGDAGARQPDAFRHREERRRVSGFQRHVQGVEAERRKRGVASRKAEWPSGAPVTAYTRVAAVVSTR